MADNRTSQLLAASFKGVSFSVRSETSSELGRKLILHEYVNSDERFVEDQGQLPPKFSIRAFVHGDDFIARSNRLEQVLNEIGSGRLSLPTFGVFEAFAGAYSKDASQQSVGEISYTLPFFVGRPAPGPTVSRVGIEDVFQAGDQARAILEDIFSVLYPVPQTSINSIAAIGDLNNIVNDINNAIKTILLAEDLERIFRIVETVNLNTANLVNDPESLASILFLGVPEIPGLWQQISLALSKIIDTGDGVEQLSLLTNLGGGLSLSINDINRSTSVDKTSSEIPLWPPTTRQRIDRNTAREVIVQANRVASLAGVYEVAAARLYKTDDEIIAVRNLIEALHERIMRIETVDPSIIQFNPTVRSAIEDVRLAALDVIGQKEQESFQIINDNTGAPTSSFVRSHLLYAEEFTNPDDLATRAVDIGNLNTSQSSNGLIDDFKIFQVR